MHREHKKWMNDTSQLIVGVICFLILIFFLLTFDELIVSDAPSIDRVFVQDKFVQLVSNAFMDISSQESKDGHNEKKIN